MKFSRIVLAIVSIALALTANATTLEAVKKTLSAKFSNSKIHDVRPAPVDGLYEVTLSGAQVIYFSPANNALLFGEIYDLEGQSLTAEAIARANRLRLEDLPYDQALVLGPENGIPIIEFTDPDCPYCLRYDEFIRDSKVPVKRVIFFMTSIHPQTAPAKAQHILCSEDKAAAFDDIYLRRTQPTATCETGAAQLGVHANVSSQWRVQGTPTLILDGSPVTGFRKEVISNYLATKTKES